MKTESRQPFLALGVFNRLISTASFDVFCEAFSLSFAQVGTLSSNLTATVVPAVLPVLGVPQNSPRRAQLFQSFCEQHVWSTAFKRMTIEKLFDTARLRQQTRPLAMVPTAAELLRVGPIELFNRLEIVFRYILGDLFTQYGSANAGSTIMKTGKDAGICNGIRNVIGICKRHRRSGCSA